MRVRPRFTNQPLVKGAPVERLVLLSYSREYKVGTEMFGRHHGKPECGIRQSAMEPRQGLVGHKAGWIDDDFAGVEFGLQNIGEDFERGKVRVFAGAYVNTNRAG